MDAWGVTPNIVHHPKHTRSLGNLILPIKSNQLRKTLSVSFAISHELTFYMHGQMSHAQSQIQACIHESKQEAFVSHNVTQ